MTEREGGSTPGEAVAWACVGSDGEGEMMGEGGDLQALELAVTAEGEGGMDIVGYQMRDVPRHA